MPHFPSTSQLCITQSWSDAWNQIAFKLLAEFYKKEKYSMGMDIYAKHYILRCMRSEYN